MDNNISNLEALIKLSKLPIPIESTGEYAESVYKEDGGLPRYAKVGDAGMDVRAVIEEDIIIEPLATAIIPVGIKVALPVGAEIQVRDRSGVASKSLLWVKNSPGTVDSGYRDEVGVIIHNSTPFPKDLFPEIHDALPIIDISSKEQMKSYSYGRYLIPAGTRLAQIVVCPVFEADWKKTSDVSAIGNNRKSSYGGTGLK